MVTFQTACRTGTHVADGGVMGKWMLRGLLSLGVLGLAVQLVPYGRSHTNPPVQAEPAWSSPDVRTLAARACFDCHSNETRWPWYSNVAPASWLVQRDVDRGRARLNYSEWNRPQSEADDSAEAVAKGEMPPWFYLPLHPDARLSPGERARLIEGLAATFGGEGEREAKESAALR
jgi:hypothetical protein